MRTRIKICCMASLEEVELAIHAGDWSVSAQFVRRSPRPVFLAGGLSPANVGEAMRMVRPFGVDVCTGVRTEGRLDRAKLDAFIRAVRSGDAALATGAGRSAAAHRE